MAGLSLKGIVKDYGAVRVIHGVDLEITDGEFCVFVGPLGLWEIDAVADDRGAGGYHRR